MPVAAFTDPGGVIAREGLGVAAGSRRSLFDAVRRLLEDEAAWRVASARCTRFVAREYGEAKVLRVPCGGGLSIEKTPLGRL